MADDPRTNQALLAALEILETQMVYLENIHRTLGSLYEALLRDHPDLKKSLQEEMERPKFFPEQDALIERIRLAIHQLKG